MRKFREELICFYETQTLGFESWEARISPVLNRLCPYAETTGHVLECSTFQKSLWSKGIYVKELSSLSVKFAAKRVRIRSRNICRVLATQMSLSGCWPVDHIEDVGAFAPKNARVKCYESCLVPTRTTGKLLRKAWKKRRPNKSADRVFVFDKMRLNTAKLTSRESVYTSFGKPREMDSISKISHFKWWEFT